MTAAEPAPLREHRRLRELYWPRYEQAVQALEAARVAASAADADRTADEKARQLAEAAKAVHAEAGEIASRAVAASEPVKRFRGAGWYAAGGFALLAIMLAIASFTQPGSRLPFGIGTLGSLGIVAFLAITLGMIDTTQAASIALGHAITTETPAATPADLPAIAPEPRIASGSGNVAETQAFPFQARNNGLGAGAGAFPNAEPNRILRGKYGWGLGGAQAMRIEPQSGARALDLSSNAKEVARLPQMMPGVMPSLPGGPPEQRPAVGMGAFKPAGESGWQPNSGRAIIPNEMLTAEQERDLLRRKDIKGMPAGFGANGLATDAAPGGAATPNLNLTAPTVPLAPRAALRVDEKQRGTFEYRDALEKAKQYTSDRAESLRNRMTDGMDRQATLGGDKTQGLPEVVAPVPTKAANFTQMVEYFAHSRVQAAIPTVAPLVVREFALPRPGTKTEASVSEGDTVLWQPLIVLPSDGRTTLEFHAGAAASGYRVTIAGHTLDGRIGAVRRLVPVAKTGKSTVTPTVLPATIVEPMKP